MSYFNTATLKVRNLDQSIAMLALMNGLQKNDFKKLLTKIYPKDLTRMLARAKMYVQIEEAFMPKEAPSISTMGGGKKKQDDRKFSPRHEERSRPHSRPP